MRKKLSMQDVARMADTSAMTVSRVLSDHASVRPELRERILKVVKETGFVPNASARALARKRAKHRGMLHSAIALAVSEPKYHTSVTIWEEMYEGFLSSASELGLTVNMAMIRREELEQGLIPQGLANSEVDGILLMPIDGVNHSVLGKVAPSVVVGSRPREDCGFPAIEADARMGVKALVDHLCNLGHRRLQFVTSRLSHLPYRERAQAFETRLKELGIRGEVTSIEGSSDAAFASRFAARPAGDRPTALVASNDGRAIELLHALLAQGVRAPVDVSVVGFDGRNFGKSSVPPLTTWHVKWRDLARLALRILVDQIQGEVVAPRTLVGGELVVRGSTGSAPSAGEGD